MGVPIGARPNFGEESLQNPAFSQRDSGTTLVACRNSVEICRYPPVHIPVLSGKDLQTSLKNMKKLAKALQVLNVNNCGYPAFCRLHQS